MNPSDWISVDERMPFKPGTYLTYSDVYKSVKAMFFGELYGKMVFQYRRDCFAYNITHWMPIVPPERR